MRLFDPVNVDKALDAPSDLNVTKRLLFNEVLAKWFSPPRMDVCFQGLFLVDPREQETFRSGEHEASVSDTEIAEALQRGCDDTANTFVRTHMPWMLGVAHRILRDEAAAEDCVQEAFFSVFANIGKFEGRLALKNGYTGSL